MTSGWLGCHSYTVNAVGNGVPREGGTKPVNKLVMFLKVKGF